VGALVESLDPQRLSGVLSAYVDALMPWARQTAQRMIGEVDKRDRAAWRDLGESISTQLHHDIAKTPVGERMRELLDEQVVLITSIPRQAAQRAHELVLEGLEGGRRAKSVAQEIMRTTEVTKSRALLIARTETSRTATVLMQARSEAVGATHYRWITAGDRDVRPGHKAMEGKVCEWANPPLVMEGDPPNRPMHFHPGSVWNCRCYAEPIITDPYEPTVKGRRRQ
jgi:SPP1 gp7 family putative phage head morphogenesis protein